MSKKRSRRPVGKRKAKAPIRPAAYLKQGERLQLRRFFAANATYRKLFGDRWVTGILSPFLTRDEAPPIVWTLLNPGARERLTEALELISAQRNVAPIVKDLKSGDQENVEALLNELEVFRLMRKHNASVVWKPPSALGRGARAPDLGAKHKDQDLFVEVFTVLESKDEAKTHRLFVPLDRSIGQMKDHFYVVMYDVLGELSRNDVTRAIAFVKRAIAELRRAGKERGQIIFKIGPRRLLRFTFKRGDGRRKGYHGMTTFRMSGSLDARRIKDKLLDKLEHFQFQEGPELKGYVIVLNALTADKEDVADALLGKSAVELTREGTTYTTKAIRHANGVLADEVLGKRFLDEVDFVVAMTGRKARPPEVIAIHVNEDRGRLTADEVEKFFTE